MSSAETYFVAATTVTPAPASAQTAPYASRIASAFMRALAPRARAARHARCAQARRRPRPAARSRSRPSTGPRRTRSPGDRRPSRRGRATRCGCERSRSTSARSAASAWISVAGTGLARKIGSLVVDQVECQLVAVACEEAAGEERVDRPVELECVARDDEDDVVLDAWTDSEAASGCAPRGALRARRARFRWPPPPACRDRAGGTRACTASEAPASAAFWTTAKMCSSSGSGCRSESSV